MAASYPTSTKSFSTKVDGAGNTIFAAHVNDLQAEVVAIENALRTGLAHDLLFTDALYDIGKSGATRPRDGFFSRHVTVGSLLTSATMDVGAGSGAASAMKQTSAHGYTNDSTRRISLAHMLNSGPSAIDDFLFMRGQLDLTNSVYGTPKFTSAFAGGLALWMTDAALKIICTATSGANVTPKLAMSIETATGGVSIGSATSAGGQGNLRMTAPAATAGPVLILDGTLADKSNFLGELQFAISGTPVGRFALREFTDDRYGFSFGVFNGALTEYGRMYGTGGFAWGGALTDPGANNMFVGGTITSVATIASGTNLVSATTITAGTTLTVTQAGGNVSWLNTTVSATAVTNVSSPIANADQHAIRVGDHVMVTGSAQVTTSGVGACEVGIGVPIGSNFASAEAIAGVVTLPSTVATAAVIRADTTNDRAKITFTALAGATFDFYYAYQYIVS